MSSIKRTASLADLNDTLTLRQKRTKTSSASPASATTEASPTPPSDDGTIPTPPSTPPRRRVKAARKHAQEPLHLTLADAMSVTQVYDYEKREVVPRFTLDNGKFDLRVYDRVHHRECHRYLREQRRFDLIIGRSRGPDMFEPWRSSQRLRCTAEESTRKYAPFRFLVGVKVKK